MGSNNNKEKLFKEFPPVTREQWEEKIKTDLKGADYEKKLVWDTGEGFKVQPYYRKEDLFELDYLDIFPGDFPFVRGNYIRKVNWNIRQDIRIRDWKEANKKALIVLDKGINSLGFDLCNLKPDNKKIELLLENIPVDTVELNFTSDYYHSGIVHIIKNLVRNNNEKEEIRVSVDYDPLAYLTLHGNYTMSGDDVFKHCIELIKVADHLPNFKVVAVKGEIFKNSGAAIVEELAFTLAMANEYLSKLTERGLSIDEIAPRMQFNMTCGSTYFLEIAKLRAARILWSHIVNAYNPSSQEIARMYVHTETARWNKTLYDPYVNMLRTTTEAISAIIGGTDSLRIKAFNEIFEEPTEFSERIARNQQLLLKHESHLNEVVDPGTGSYYIENLTDSVLNEAWKLFLEIDELGGYLEALKKGYIQEKIKEAVERRNNKIATRNEILLGTNQYPDFPEKIEKDIDPAVLEAKDFSEKDAIIEPLKPYRGSQPFERLRYKTDRYAQKNKRPVVFMFTYGDIAMRRARAQFSCNFFACAGFKVIDNLGFKTIDHGVKAAMEKKADIVVACSSYDQYLKIAPELKTKLEDKAIVAVAGYPKDVINELKEKDIHHFIHRKSNVLEKLKEFQEILGIE